MAYGKNVHGLDTGQEEQIDAKKHQCRNDGESDDDEYGRGDHRRSLSVTCQDIESWHVPKLPVDCLINSLLASAFASQA